MKMVFLFSIYYLTTLSFTNVPPVENNWMTDYEKAFIIAKRENKHVLINFTGSDWCGWCKKLDREVFGQKAFQTYAKENLVLLKLDYPRRTPQPREVKIKNQGYARTYGVLGFPTIIIAEANQKVVLRTGYKAGGPNSYVKHIKQAIW